VSSSAAASEDSNRISQLLHDAFFSVNNLACPGFYTANRKSVRIDLDPCDRTVSIRFVEFEATVDPVVVSPDLKSASPITVTYFLRLPQSIAPAAATISTATAPDVSLTDSNTATPSIAMEQILHALASGTTVADLDLTDPSVATALSTLVMQASAPTDDPLMTNPRKLFTPPTASFIDATTTSPSIRRYLTTAQESTVPTYYGALDFFDSQSKFDAVFPPNDRKPISSLRRSNEPASTFDRENPATHVMNLFTAECRLIIFSNVIRLDYIRRHDFSSAAHLHMTVKKIRSLTLDFNTHGHI
jgi:hypothetical protein